MRDPFGDINPFRRILDGGMPAAPTLARFPALPADEAAGAEQGLLGRTATSGLHWAGSELDKLFGGRAIRGVLGGKPGEALSAIPFSDTVGLTDPAEAVTGEQLLRGWGYDPSQGNWAERHLAGPALEIALDPGTYLSFGGKGAATALGKVLQKGGHVPGWSHRALIEGFEHTAPGLRAAGKTDEAIAQMMRQGSRIAPDPVVAAAKAAGFGGDLARQPLSGIAGVGLPFGENAASLGHGPVSRAVAGGFDVAKDAIKFAPGVSHLRALLDNRAGRQWHPGAQRAYEAGAVPGREAIEAATRLEEHSLRSRFDAVMHAVGDLPGFEPESQKVIRGLAEGAPQFADPARQAVDFARRHGLKITPGVADPAAVSAAISAQYPELAGIADAVRRHGQRMFAEAKSLGLPLEELGDDWIHYAMRRYIAASPTFQGKDEARWLPTVSGSNLKRSQRLKDIPGGTEQINEWAMDKGLVGPGRLPDPAKEATILAGLRTKALTGHPTGVLTPAEEAELAARAKVLNQTARTAEMKARIYADLERTALLDHPTGVLTPREMQSLNEKATSVLQFLKDVPHGHVAGPVPIPFFTPDAVGDLVARGKRHAATMGAGRALYEGIGGMARPIAELPNPAERTTVFDFLYHQANLRRPHDFPAPLTAADEAAIAAAGFRDSAHARDVARAVQGTAAGYTPPVSAAELAGYGALGPVGTRLTRELHAPAVHAYQALARQGMGDIEDVYNGLVNPADELHKWALSTRDAGALAGMLQGFVAPSELHPFLGWMRGAQTLFRNSVYPMWPASHVKNAIGAFYNDWLHGTRLSDVADAVRIIRGRGVADPARYAATAGMRPGRAAEVLHRLAYGHGKVFGGVGQFNERLGAHGLDDERLMQGLLGEARLTPTAPGRAPHPGLLEMAGQPGAWNPLHQEGVGGGLFHRGINRLFRGGAEALPYREDRFLPLRAGRAVGTQVEDLARLAGFLGAHRGGMSPEQAGLLTRAIHFDYSDLTPVEQHVLKNVIPFYTFLRKNLPYQVRMAFERPSAVSPTLHAIGGASGGEWLPEYLASGTAVPLGDERDGTRRYLTSLGLPLEEAFGRFKFHGALPAVGPTALAFAASLNPALKGPAEWAFDTQFHTGRKLSDLDTHGPASLWGQLPEDYARPLAQLLANSPLARVTTTARTWTDPRKSALDAAVNTLTGFRISDVDVAKQRAIAARKELESLLGADPRLAEFTNYYPRPDRPGPLPPELVDRLRLFTTMKDAARAAAEARQRRAGAVSGSAR